jgi:hypothetical protein
MKKLIIGVAILLALSSCNKKRCWQCTYSHPNYSTKKYDICDKDRKEIKLFEDEYTKNGYTMECGR